MFTLQQIKTAHAKVKTGADFPGYIQEIKQLGLARYEFKVKDGSVTYYNAEGQEVNGAAIFAPQAISPVSSSEKLRQTIANHQQGQTDFLTFCRQAADAGVEKWEIDTRKMLCTYYDVAGNSLVEEPIPQGEYAGSNAF